MIRIDVATSGTTPAAAREKLEAVIWRERGGDPRRPASDVDAILAAADAYAQARVATGVQAELERIKQARRDAMAAALHGDVQPCGTPAAAMRHRRHGDIPTGKKLRDVCPPCADAEARQSRQRLAQAATERTGRPQ